MGSKGGRRRGRGRGGKEVVWKPNPQKKLKRRVWWGGSVHCTRMQAHF